MAWGRLLALRGTISLLYRQDYEKRLSWLPGRFGTEGGSAALALLALWAMAEAQERARTIGESIATLREAQRTGRALGNQFFAAMVEVFLATGLKFMATPEAVAVCEETIEHYTDETGSPSQ